MFMQNNHRGKASANNICVEYVMDTDSIFSFSSCHTPFISWIEGKFFLPLPKNLHHKSFPMKEFEISDDSKFHPYIGLWRHLTTAKENHTTFLTFCHFLEKDYVLMFSKRCSGVCYTVI